MNTPSILTFLGGLAANNTKDWMDAHKAEYQAAQKEFIDLVQELICRLAQSDPSVAGLEARELIFRLNRDTRFSNDKSPYNPVFRAHISSGGRAPIPAGYFLCVMPGAAMLGGGLFAAPFPEVTARIRNAIAERGQELQDILNQPDFASCFTMKGETLKNVPKGYDADSPFGELLKYKSWYLEYPVSPDVFSDPEKFMDFAVEKFLLMRPFNQFINTALEGFQMPKR